MIIRNDDVAADTTLQDIRTFCEICDRYGVMPLHAITAVGRVRGVSVAMDNATIRRVSGTDLFSENVPVLEYLRGRTSDVFAVHGLWHTHCPSGGEIVAADELLLEAGIQTAYYVPPFNEGPRSGLERGANDSALMVSGAGVPRLEEYLEAGDPGAELVYLHSWRFEYGPFTWAQLDKCLKRLTRR